MPSTGAATPPPRAAELASRLASGAADMRDELVAQLAELTALDAPSGDPDRLLAAAGPLEARLSGLGLEVTRHSSPAGPQVEATRGSPGSGAPLVLCHYDTVWPAGTAAERPFRVADEVATGPGVLDMRAGIVAALGALDLLGRVGTAPPAVRLLLTPDEETGSAASRALIADRARRSAIVLVPEPALPGGALKTARKGWIVYRVEARGRAAHAGLEPEAGVSAIDELVDVVTGLRGLADRAGTTVNCGLIGGGTAANVVADRATAEIDIRVPDAAAEAAVRAALDRLPAGRRGAPVAVTELHSRPPLERTPAVAAAAERARRLAALLGLDLGEGSAGGVSDANLVAAEGATALDGLGPEGSGAHAIDERVSVRSLVERTALIALLLRELPR